MSESTRFTDITWATLDPTSPYGILSRQRAQGGKVNGEYTSALSWTHQHDLAAELAERQPHLTFDEARSLVSHVCSGLPVVLTWKHRLNGPTGQVDGPWEVTRTTVIVDELSQPAVDPKDLHAVPGSIRLRYSGFGHPIYLTQILAIEQVDNTVTFHDSEPVKGQPLPEAR